MADSKPVSYTNAILNSYDVDSESLKVKLIGSGTPSTPSIVELSNGTDLLTTTNSGPKIALDVNVINGLSIDIQHTADSIRLGDGTSYFTSSTNGSKVGLDVNILGGSSISGSFTQTPNGPTITTYGNSNSLPSNNTSITSSYTVPIGKTAYIQKIYLSGTQVGTYTIKIGSNVLINYRTSVTKFSEILDLSTGSAFGVSVATGINITVTSTNNGAVNGDFDATIQVMEV